MIAKDRLLPSLLDRLTDDSTIQNSVLQLQKTIDKLEKQIATLEQQELSAELSYDDQISDLKRRRDKNVVQFQVTSGLINSISEIRECVKRDLDWLLNAHQANSQEMLEDYPEVASSVINYGFPDLTGQTASGIDIPILERLLKQVILDFEPRILRHTLEVSLHHNETKMQHNTLTFEIKGELWHEPQPIHLHLLTELELEDGGVAITEFQA